MKGRIKMRKSKKYYEWQASKPLLRGAKILREQREQEMKDMFNKDVLIPHSNGEYSPVNPDDLVLADWCKKYNKKLREAKAFVKMATDPNRFAPIQKSPVGYRPLNTKDKVLTKWCIDRNAEIRNKIYIGEKNNG